MPSRLGSLKKGYREGDILFQQSLNFQGPKDDVELCRYYNDAIMGVQILYEVAAGGSKGAKAVLREVAQCVSTRACVWKFLSEKGDPPSRFPS